MTPVGSFTIGADHPSLPGHFPGRPIVPGVLLLDRALSLIAAARSGRPALLQAVKFLQPVGPGQAVAVACASEGDRLAFRCSVDGALVLRGSLVLAP